MAKRILIYTNHFFPEQFKINEIVDWLPKNYEVRVITGIPNYPSGKYFKGYGIFSSFNRHYKNNIVVNRLPLIPRGRGSYLQLLLNYITYFISCSLFTIYLIIFKKKYDYIFVHHTSPILIAVHPIFYGFFYNSKKYLWDLDIWPETLEALDIIKSKNTINFLSIIVKHIYSFYDKILIGSSGFREIVKKRFSKEIIYFPNWAEYELEQNKCIEKINLIIPSNKKIIMYTGNIGESQNFEPLVETIQILKENFYWVFIGDGRYKSNFQQKINKKNLNNYCAFIGQVNIKNIPSYSKYADFMFLSLKNTFIFSKTIPAKLQSYMALGKPIIAVLNGEAATIISSSKCGIVQQNSDYRELANQILDLNNYSKIELIKMGQNGRDYYNKFFSREKRKNQLKELFK